MNLRLLWLRSPYIDFLLIVLNVSMKLSCVSSFLYCGNITAMALLKWGCNVLPPSSSFSTPKKTYSWERRTCFIVGMRYTTWPGFTKKQKWFCGATVGFMFAFLLLWWAGNSVAWAEWLPVSVWYYLSANARLSCQEIKPTQYNFIANNYVKFFFLCFINFFFFPE